MTTFEGLPENVHYLILQRLTKLDDLVHFVTALPKATSFHGLSVLWERKYTYQLRLFDNYIARHRYAHRVATRHFITQRRRRKIHSEINAAKRLHSARVHLMLKE